MKYQKVVYLGARGPEVIDAKDCGIARVCMVEGSEGMPVRSFLSFRAPEVCGSGGCAGYHCLSVSLPPKVHGEL